MAQKATPWGRFKLVSKEPAVESDHLYFFQQVHRIGRSPERCDIVLDLLYISSVHCVLELEGRNAAGAPIVRLEDKSRNGVWVNGDRVGRGKSTYLEANFTIHFTKPGLKAVGVAPKIFKFELIDDNEPREAETVKPTQELISATAESPASERKRAPTTSETPTKKRRRVDNDALTHGPTQEIVNDLTSKLEDAQQRITALSEALSRSTTEGQLALDRAQVENAELQSLLDARTAEHEQEKVKLTARVNELASELQVSNEKCDETVKLARQASIDHAAKVATLEKESAAVKDGMKETDAALAEHNKQIVALKAENSELLKLLASSEKQLEDAQSVVTEETATQTPKTRHQSESASTQVSSTTATTQTPSSATTAVTTQTTTTAPEEQSSASNEALARLQTQLIAARDLFKQIRALGQSGEASLADIEAPSEAASTRSDLSERSDHGTDPSDLERPSANEQENDVNDDNSVQEVDDDDDDNEGNEHKTSEPASDDASAMEVDDDANIEVEIKEERDETSDRDDAAVQEEGEEPAPRTNAKVIDLADGDVSDHESAKSSDSHSSLLGAGDADTEGEEKS